MIVTKNLSLEKLIDLGYEIKIGETFKNGKGEELTFLKFETFITGATSLKGDDAVKAGYNLYGEKFGNIAVFTNNKNQKVSYSLNLISRRTDLNVTFA